MMDLADNPISRSELLAVHGVLFLDRYAVMQERLRIGTPPTREHRSQLPDTLAEDVVAPVETSDDEKSVVEYMDSDDVGIENDDDISEDDGETNIQV